MLIPRRLIGASVSLKTVGGVLANDGGLGGDRLHGSDRGDAVLGTEKRVLWDG